MGQFTALMTILLAFFILMVTMAPDQESGFNEGIGDVRDAFGLQGGIGMFTNIFFGKGGSKTPNPDSGDNEEKGIHEDLVKSSGGAGNTEANVSDSKLGKYLRLKIKGRFPKGEYKIPQEMKVDLDKTGIGFTLFDYKVSIRCYTDELDNFNNDRTLAMARAKQIMLYLHLHSAVPYSKMSCAGYTTASYFGEIKSKGQKAVPRQGNYFYIYIKKQ